MNKRFMKVAISLLCVMTLLFGSVLTFSVPAVAAVEIPTPSQELTWSDFGITEDKAYGTDSGGLPDWLFASYGNSNNLMNGYKFIGQMTLADNARFYYGTGDLGHSFNIKQTGTGLQLVLNGGTLTGVSGEATTFTAAQLGVSGAMAEAMLQIEIQMWNIPDDAKSGRLAVWVNQNLLGVYDAVISDSAMKFGSYIAINDTTHTSKVSADIAIPTDLTEVGWTDFSRDGSALVINSVLTYTGASYSYTGGTFNDVLFNGDVIFPSTNDTKVILFGDWHGLYLDPNGTTLEARVQGNIKLVGGTKTLQAADYGLTSFNDTRFNLKISVTGNTDGTAANLRFWINDQYAFSARLNASTTTELINGTILPMNTASGGTPSIVACSAVNVPVPTDYPVLSWSDFGVSEGAIPCEGGHLLSQHGNANGGTMNNALFDGDLKITATNQQLAMVTPGEVSWGLIFKAQDDGTLRISGTTYTLSTGALTVHPLAYGLNSFAGDRFNLKILTTNVANFAGTVTLWINDYYVATINITQGADFQGTGLMGQGLYAYAANAFEAYASSKPLPEADTSVPTGLDAFTWKDLNGAVTDGVYTNTFHSGFYKDNTVAADDVLLQGYVTIPSGGKVTVFGPLGNKEWGGIQLSLNGTGLKIYGSQSFWETAHSNSVTTVSAADIGIDTFENTEFLLQMSVQYIDRDGDGAATDLKMGIWVNGVNVATRSSAQTNAQGAFTNVVNGYYVVSDHLNKTYQESATDSLRSAALSTTMSITSTAVTLRSYMPVAEDLTVVTWEDLIAGNASYPITYGEPVIYWGQEYGYNVGANNTVFDGVIQFTEATDTAYIRWFGGSNVWQGVDLMVQNENGADILRFRGAGFKFMRGTVEVTLKLQPADFGLTSFTEKFRLQMALTNLAADGKSADLRVWINGIYAGWVTVTATGSNTLGNRLIPADEGDGAGAAVFTPYEKLITEVTVPDASATVTWKDFANGSVVIPNGAVEAPSVGAYAIYGWASNYDSLDGIRFAGQLQMGPKAEIHYGGADPSHGVQLILQDDGTLKVYNAVGTLAMADGSELKNVFTAAELGIDGAIADQHINVAFQLWNVSSDKKSARVAAWVNDTLLGIYDVAFTVDGVTCGDALGLMSGAFVIGGPIEKLPEDFTVLRPYDFGVSDGIYYGDTANVGIVFSGTADVSSVDKTLWVFDEFSTDCETWIWIAGDPAGDWLGLQFRVNTDGTAKLVQASTSFTIPAVTFTNEVAGVDILGGTYSLKFTVEQPSSTELKLGVWFNDVLYNNEYITITNVDEAHVGPNLRLYPALTGGRVVIRSTNWETPTDLNNINFGSFDNFSENTKYPQAIEVNAVQGTYQGGDSLLNTSFRGNITFHYETDGAYYMCYGGINGAGTWNGLRMQVRSDKITFSNGGETAWSNVGKLTLYPADFGLTSFTDSELELGIDLTMYGDSDDMLMYFYVNGTLYNNAPMVLFNFGSNIGNTWVMHAVNYTTDYYQVGEFSRELIYDLYHDLSKGDYTYYDPDGVQQSISLPGVYEVEWNDGAFTYKQTVVAYEVGDPNSDGNVNVLDVVKTMVVLAKGGNDASFDKSADCNEDGTVTADDVTALRLYLLGKVQKAEEGSVMPIGGFYGPNTDTLINAETYQQIANLGINEIVYTQYAFSNSLSAASKWNDMMTLAQNYGIGMYVTDGRLDGATNYSAAQLAEYLKAYNHYQSFSGVYVVDEPYLDGTYPLPSGYKSRNLASYSALAQSLANVGVNAYVNAYPYQRNLANKNGWAWAVSEKNAQKYYKTYIEAIATQMQVPYLSYDKYPFDSCSVTDSDMKEYFQNMAIVSAVAKEKGLDWRPHLQAGTNWNPQDSATTPNATPSQGEFYWNANISLAMGAKALQYFPLTQPVSFAETKDDGTMDYQRNGLIGANGQLTSWGGYAATLNAYVRKIDDVLMNAEHKGVIATGGYAQSIGTSSISSTMSNISSDNPVVTSYNGMTPEATTDSYGAFIGCFDGTGKYAGKTIYYVVNYNVSNQSDVIVTLKLGSSQNYEVLYMNDEYDEPVTTGDTVEVIFEQGGEAALVIVG